MTLTVKCWGPKKPQKNTIRALEPRGILVWRGCFAIIWVSLSQDNIIFKLLPCFNMKTNCAAEIGIFCCNDKTVVIYSHLYNSYTARRRLQIDASRHPSHSPPTPTPTPTTHTLEFRMTFHLSKILMIKMTLDKWMKGYDRKSYAMKRNKAIVQALCRNISWHLFLRFKFAAHLPESATASVTSDKGADFQMFLKKSNCSLHTLDDDMHVYGFNLANLQTVLKQFLYSSWSCWCPFLCLLGHGNPRAWLLVQFPSLVYRNFSTKTIKVISIYL